MSDIHISNSGSGFFGIEGITLAGREWIDAYVYDAHCGQAWTDDRHLAMDIANGALEAGLEVD